MLLEVGIVSPKVLIVHRPAIHLITRHFVQNGHIGRLNTSSVHLLNIIAATEVLLHDLEQHLLLVL